MRETHALNVNGHERSTHYEFVMRCWTRSELQSLLSQSGFVAVNYFGSYDPLIPLGTTARIVAISQRSLRARP